MKHPHPLSQEVLNRIQALPSNERRDYGAALVRITVEVTREWLEHYPAGVEEFLAMYHDHNWSTH